MDVGYLHLVHRTQKDGRHRGKTSLIAGYTYQTVLSEDPPCNRPEMHVCFVPTWGIRYGRLGTGWRRTCDVVTSMWVDPPLSLQPVPGPAGCWSRLHTAHQCWAASNPAFSAILSCVPSMLCLFRVGLGKWGRHFFRSIQNRLVGAQAGNFQAGLRVEAGDLQSLPGKNSRASLPLSDCPLPLAPGAQLPWHA